MIRIMRTRCPDCLRQGAGSLRYRHRKVVETLWRMQREKCCYCEQRIPNQGHAKAVEHFRPQSLFRSRRNDWGNLLLACAQCNGKKSDTFPTMLTNNVDESKVVYLRRPTQQRPAILNPAGRRIDPEDHLDYRVELSESSLMGQVFPRANSVLGRTTIEVTGIDQTFLHRKRHQHMWELVRSLQNLDQSREIHNDDGLRSARIHFQNLMAKGAEFAGLSREFARKMGLDTDYGLQIPGMTQGARAV